MDGAIVLKPGVAACFAAQLPVVQARVQHDAQTSTHVAAWSYEQVERAGALVWAGGDRFEHLGREWRARFY